MTFVVAIIGRPNVGKSTLFNRLVGQKLALVDDIPGVTRDRRQGTGRISDLEFSVFDTAGLENIDDGGLESRMRQQTEAAVDEADVVFMLIDARVGITPLDSYFCQWLRTVKNQVVLVANKCEGRAAYPGLLESYSLGLGEPIAISAEHGEGMADLYSALSNFEQKHFQFESMLLEEGINDVVNENAKLNKIWLDQNAPKVLRLAIVGRPNVGKSTLINSLLGENRVLTGPEAGITRDAIEVEWTWKEKPLKLFDTAGLRRKSKIDGRLEKASGDDTWRAIRFAHVVVLLLDATMMLERQDLNIARLVVEEGRALVLGVNKWDAVLDRSAALKLLKDRMQISLPQVKNISYVTLSALEGRGLDKTLDSVFSAYELWNQRVSTSHLNRWLAYTIDQHPPPLAGGRRIKLRYITQAKTRPPTFICFCSQPDKLPDSYVRYLVNSLRKEFSLPGVPIRFLLRGGENPYV
jgi:GTP-binding protein